MKNLSKTILTYSLIIFILGIQSCGSSSDKNIEQIKIGAILPLTGPAASAGVDSQRGLSLAVESINDTISKYKDTEIKLEIKDSKAKANEAVSALNQLNLSAPPNIIYSQLSNVSLAIKGITEKEEQILVAVSGAENLLENTNFVYRNYIRPKYYADKTSDIISDSLNIEEVGIFYPNSEFGLSIKENIVNSFMNNRIGIAFKTTYDSEGKNFKNTILESLNGRSQLQNIYVIGVGTSLGLIIKQLRENGYKGNIIGGIELPYPDVTNLLPQKIRHNIYYVDFKFDPENPLSEKGTKFVSSFKNRYGSLPTTSAVIAYDAINIFIDHVINENPNAEKLNQDHVYEGASGEINITDNEIYYQLALKNLQ